MRTQIQRQPATTTADGDGDGLLVEGNEFVGNVRVGQPRRRAFSRCGAATTWYFRKNYLHDFGGQGFFVKDQASAIDGMVVEDNLIVRQNLPVRSDVAVPDVAARRRSRSSGR